MRTMKTLFALAGVLVCTTPLHAQQAWPDRPIRFIVTSAAGGGIDLMARITAEALGKQLPQRVIVENNGAAGGLVATRTVAKADPDGYTFLFQGPGHAALPYVRKNPGYDVRKDFESVSLITRYPLVMVTRPDFGVKTLPEFIAKVKAEPGKYTFGSSGVGGASHIPLEAFVEQAKLKMVHVPYRGSGQATAALLGNQIDLVIDGLAPQLSRIREGTVVALGVSTRERSPYMNQIPTMAETLPGYEYPMWVALFAPAKTPKAIVDKMSAAISAALKDPATKKRFDDLLVETIASTPAQLDQFVDEQLKFNKVIIDKANIHVDE